MLSLRRSAFQGLILLLALLSAAPAEAQVGGPPTPPVTLWNFLGIPQGIRKLQGATRNRRGNHPNREPKPPLKALADPANLESKDASIKKAAEIKQAEDLKKQKIKAVKYLASIGCGCYDVDGGVTKALVASMNDCTEDVRYETIKAIQEAAEGECCSKCGMVCCCNRDILQELSKLAYERDDHGCYVEPSERVREIAAETMRTCCPNDTSPVIVEEPPKEQQQERESPDDESPEDSRESESDESPAPGVEELPAVDGVTGYEAVPASEVSAESTPSGSAELSLEGSQFGVVLHVSPEHGLAHIRFNHSEVVAPEGSWVGVYEGAGETRMLLARLQVVKSFQGAANIAGPVEAIAAINRGDVVLRPQQPQPDPPAPVTVAAETSAPAAEPPRRAVHPGFQRVAAPSTTVAHEAIVVDAVEAPVHDTATTGLSTASAQTDVEPTPPASASFAPAAPRRPLTATFMR